MAIQTVQHRTHQHISEGLSFQGTLKLNQRYITKMHQYVCFSNVKPSAHRVKQLLSGAGYTCPRDSVSKATKTAGAVRSVGQAAVTFLWPGSVGPRKQTSQEHNHINLLPVSSFHWHIMLQYIINLVETFQLGDHDVTPEKIQNSTSWNSALLGQQRLREHRASHTVRPIMWNSALSHSSQWQNWHHSILLISLMTNHVSQTFYNIIKKYVIIYIECHLLNVIMR